jgi:hypothetical protein
MPLDILQANPTIAFATRFRMHPKVFCIGFHKTGTTSLGVALAILGYHVTGPDGVNDPEIEKNVHAMTAELSRRFDAFQDNPWPVVYKEMDQAHPGSKFVLSMRSSESWIRSIVGHFGRAETPMRRWIYGAGDPIGNEQTYVRRYEAHNAEVRAYFAQRPNDLLMMDLTAGDGWAKLCAFLGRTAPALPFPHEMSAERRKQGRDRRHFQAAP